MRIIPMIIAIAVASLIGGECLEAASFIWGGGAGSKNEFNNDLTSPGNWIPWGVPKEKDHSQFTGAGSYLPHLAMGESFDVGLLALNCQDTYTFQVNGKLSFLGHESDKPFESGVQNLSLSRQIFEISEDGEVKFGNNGNASFAKSSNVNTVVYRLGDPILGSSGLMTFNSSSSAGGAQIDVFENSSLMFNDMSSAADARINIDGNSQNQNFPTLNFNGSSEAGKAMILIGGADAAFADLSTANRANITLLGIPSNNSERSSTIPGVLDMFQFASAGDAMIFATGGSYITFFESSFADNCQIDLGNTTQPASFGIMPIGFLDFIDDSQAGTATINVQGGYREGDTEHQSRLVFEDRSSADAAKINLGDALTGFGGKVEFFHETKADTATIQAGQTSQIVFHDLSSAEEAAITLNDQSVLSFFGSSKSAKSTIALTSASTVVNFAQSSGRDVFEGSISGSGVINKTGEGWIEFIGSGADFKGTTNVHQGIFALRNTLGGNVTVYNRGVLAGDGTVLNHVNLQDGGRIAPGTGTMNIHGNLVQESGSIYEADPDPSLIHVKGTATLNPGAIVNISTGGDPVQLPPNTTLDLPILKADGGVIGTYSGISSSNPLLSGFLSFTANQVNIRVVNTFSFLPETYNQKQIGNQLQTLSDPTPAQGQFLLGAASLAAPNARHVLDQLSGEEYTHALIVAELSNQQFIQRLYDPLRAILSTEPCCKNPCEACCEEKKWELWLDGDYKRSFVNGTKNARGYKSKGYDFTLGAQAAINPQWHFGTALSYEKNTFSYHSDAHASNYSVLAGFYGLYRPDCFYVLSDLVLGASRYDLRRFISVPNSNFESQGHPKIFQGDFYIEAGKDFNWACVLFQPFAGLEAGYFHLNKVKEHTRFAQFGLTIKERSRGVFWSRLGLHMTTQEYCGIARRSPVGISAELPAGITIFSLIKALTSAPEAAEEV